MEDLEKVIEDLIAKREAVSSKVNKEIKEDNKVPAINYNYETKENESNLVYNKIIDKKKDIIKHLQAAKLSHKKWMSYVQILIRLGDIEQAKASIPINYTLCDFGKWYYGEGLKLSFFSNYTEMEAIHKQIHDTYLQIYELYLTPIKGFLFNSEKSQLEKRHKKAMALSQILDEYSKIMFDLLISVEISVKNMSNEEFLNKII